MHVHVDVETFRYTVTFRSGFDAESSAQPCSYCHQVPARNTRLVVIKIVGEEKQEYTVHSALGAEIVRQLHSDLRADKSVCNKADCVRQFEADRATAYRRAKVKDIEPSEAPTTSS